MRNCILLRRKLIVRMSGLLFIFAFLNLFIPANAQYYPVDYFQSPMDTPMYLSAPFGSLRDNHFHSGMDIRTYEKEGLPVYAVADGYVARIKYSPVGYGKALYIDHPNGYTSVYGHLQNAEGEIAGYIRKYQYEIERFDFDHFPGKALKVKKGQIIGWSGNSGGSTGPHLHFEIRDTKTEQVINPQLFGIYGVDLYPPVIRKILVYTLEQNRPVLIKEVSINKSVMGVDSVYSYPDTLLLPAGSIGFAAEAYDHLVNEHTEYSLYGMELIVDDKKRYAYKLDRFAFDDTRSVNVHIDYAMYKEEKVRYQKCFKDDGNRIGIYSYLRNKGKFLLQDSFVHVALITATDIAGYSFHAKVYFKLDPNPQIMLFKRPKCTSAIFYPEKQNTFKTKDIEITVPAKALYDTLAFCYQMLSKERNSYSFTHQVQDLNTPLNSSMTISIKPDAGTEFFRDKMLIASLYPSGFMQSVGGGFENGWVTVRTSTFGNFLIVADSTAPVITPLNISKDGEIKDTAGIRISVEDNFSGIGTYRATLNGKWILMEYDSKNNVLFHPFDVNTARATLSKLVLTVTDKKNNTATYQKDIIITP
jgi:hypothetical protein